MMNGFPAYCITRNKLKYRYGQKITCSLGLIQWFFFFIMIHNFSFYYLGDQIVKKQIKFIL